ncbi:MAG: aromatic acid exporter family protein [Clostridia bacterium]|nr:aromatic acid exporter family protein [Clostridia bacterium]
MNKINYNKVFRIAVGSTLSYFICDFLGLEYSASAAVITLLSIQDTRRETVRDVIKRILSYFYAMLSACILFTFIGFNEAAFLIFMALLVTVSYLLDWTSTLSSSTVVTTHFLLAENFSHSFVFNEIMLIIIGTAAALLLNIFFINNTKKAARDCEYIELDISDMLKKTAGYINKDSAYDSDWFNFLYEKIDNCCHKVINYGYNMDIESSRYYMEYFEMRKEQCQAVDRMCRMLNKYVNLELPMANEICDFIYRISNNIHSKGTYKNDLIFAKDITVRFETLPMPENKEQLNAYTCVSEILQELYYFLELNYKFVEQLTECQLEYYWK